ncbi:non-ribosomal peptide synthetase [Chondromyces crocatus]|uniref:Carrier domain-containing protein n=1 Tax=Chondromyces crocatus TaxID=52 RepID=A0A0K1EKL1_CHOCO|nr:non-ribosomal peptide synthetase [Chondromyces crocatus]AKT41192.1 uncharacterized protein CMC5_053530 [Chondromyces crocatus]
MSMKNELNQRRAQLSPRKQELLRRRLRGEIGPIGRTAGIPRRSTEGPAPLSFAQQRLWFLDQLQPGSPFYNIPEAVRLRGPIDVDALRRCLAEVVRRHEALRTTFGVVDGRPVQIVVPDVRADLPLIDLRPVAFEQRDAALAGHLTRASQQPFDLTVGPLVRATLFRLDEASHVLLLVTHHSIADGWSMGVFVREIATLYDAFLAGNPSPLPELPIQVADFAFWQQGWLESERLKQQLAHWREKLAGCPPVLELPTDKPRPAVLQSWGARHPFSLSRPLADALLGLGQREGATLFMTLLAAFDVLLARYSGQKDIVVGSPIANRTRPEMEGLIGFFVNTLVLRAQILGELTFRGLLAQVRQTTLDAYANQDLPFEKLVEELQPARSMSHTPLFQVVFVLQNLPVPAVGRADVTLERMLVDSGTAKFDLMLELFEGEEGLSGSFEYNTTLFEPETVARLARQFEALLASIVANPDQPCVDMAILPDEELRQLAVWNATQADFPRESVHDLFEAQAARTPDAVAVRCGGSEISYGDLSRWSTQIARSLRRGGVKRGVTVGLCVERSPALIAALIGVLKAGGAYVPLDPNYPATRLAFLLEDARISVLLTQPHLQAQLPAHQARIIHVEPLTCAVEAPAVGEPFEAIGPEDLAYVMYTSGSTGTPKGVTVPHRAIVRLVKNTNFARFHADDTGLVLAPIAFDASTLEIWGPLLHGGRLALFPPHLPTLEEIAEVIRQERVTFLWLTAGLFHQLVESHLSSLADVSQLFAGGDVLSVPHVQRVLEALPQCTLVNGYGPTENTTFSTCHRMQGPETFTRSIPIGRPITNTQVLVLDERLRPSPIGVPGELYVGGEGLAHGYLDRPALTAERFVPDPAGMCAGGRLYRTGDLARLLADGAIEFLGRIDHQVKLRGFRIELGEIEAALVSLPQVSAGVVVVREDVPGDRRLFAYVTLQPGEAIEPAALRSALAASLPEHMLPAGFILLEALPLTEHGKVDRRALPSPEPQRAGGAATFVPLRTPTEERLAALWREVLQVEEVGADDDFFQAGGHSLLATQLVSRIQAAFQVNLSLRALFGTPTVAGIAREIERQQASGSMPVTPAIAAVGREGRRVKRSSLASSKGSQNTGSGR